MNNNEQNDGVKELDSMGIEMGALIKEFKDSQKYVESYTKDFQVLDNLVDAVPTDRDPGAPFVGDTTLAGLVRSIPRTSLKQLPVLSAVINGSKNSVEALVCSYILKKYAFNEDTFGKGLLSTLQIGAEQALTHGYAPFMVATGSMYEDFGATMRLIHYSDTSPEPGISDSNESDYDFVVAHPTPSRVKKILAKAMANPDTEWNVEALKQLLEETPKPADYSKFKSNPRNIGKDSGPVYKFVTRYEVGAGGRFVTFCEDVPEAPLRVIQNKSKFGYSRVLYLVIDPAALTPFGISRVRLASPNQNFMNIYYANIAAMLLINSNPPLFKRGKFIKPTDLKRGAVWHTLEPNAEISLKTMDNGSLSQFVPMSQQFTAQIQNLMGGQSSSTGSGGKVANFGKTAPGVQAGQELLGVETNQITKILENFLRQYSLSALDTILSEQSGDDYIILDDDTRNAINEVTDDGSGIPMVGEDHKLAINWEEFYAKVEVMSVAVDVSLSPDEIKEAKHKDLQDTLVVLAQNAKDIPGAAEKVAEITNLLMQDKAPLLKPMSAMPAMPMGQPPEMSQPIQQ